MGAVSVERDARHGRRTDTALISSMFGPRPTLTARPSWQFAAAALLAVVLSFALPAFSQQRPRLVVYLQTSIRSHALETALAKQMPAVQVVVVGRYRDFAREMEQKPDAALALQPVLSAHGLPVDLRGVRGGKDTENYVLLSIGSSLDKSQFSEAVFGAVDLFGRERTASFVASLLGISKVPEIKYVIKSEDLLPLLQFRSASAVLLSEVEATRIKSLTKLDLRITPLPTRVGLASASFRTDPGRGSVKHGLLTLDLETKRKLGIDAWQ